MIRTKATEAGFEAYHEKYPELTGFGFDLDTAIIDLKHKIVLVVHKEILHTHDGLFRKLALYDKGEE